MTIQWHYTDQWTCREKGERMEPSRNGDTPLTAGQKALNGFRLTQQGFSDKRAAEMTGTTARQIESVRGVLGREPSFEEGLASGEVTLNAAQVGAGFRQHRPVGGRAFGKGDKWLEVANAVTQYVAGWQSREFKFTHVPPREAEKRVAIIDDMIEGLNRCRADLVERSVRATSSLSNK